MAGVLPVPPQRSLRQCKVDVYLRGFKFPSEQGMDPNDGSAILINDLSQTYKAVREIIDLEWKNEEYKRIAHGYIEEMFLNKNKENQRNDIIDIDFLKEGQNMNKFGNLFFALLKRFSSSSNN